MGPDPEQDHPGQRGPVPDRTERTSEHRDTEHRGATTDEGAFRRFAAEVDAEEAVRRLGQEAWQRLQAEEAAHFDGLLLDLAERSEPMTLTLADGRPVAGRIEALGRDLIAVRREEGGLSLIDRGSVTSVRLPPGGPDLVGDRPTDGAAFRLDLRTALERLLVDRPTVRVWTRPTATELTGVLERGGVDVLVVGGPDGSMVHVPLAAVVEIRLADA